MTLTEIANRLQLDKGTEIPKDGRHHGPRLHFTTIYDKYLLPLKNESISILEIGIANGNSLKMWTECFTKAKVFGIDIKKCTQYETDKIKTFVADQTNRKELSLVAIKTGALDVIIVDGGHMMAQQQISLGYLFSLLKPGGMYFIEDLHTSFWPYGPYKDLYGTKLDINKNRSNTTVSVIETFIKTGKIKSEFMETSEMRYLEKWTENCQLFDLPKTEYGPNKLALLERKRV